MATSSHEGETLAVDAQSARTGEDAATSATAAGAAAPMPERVGPYRLLQALGEGGFGTVYLAEQQKPVVRRVALKIIKLGMDTRQVIARFEAERQALAMMDHPNIARVLDAGATEGGRPYFVMELVRGDPITDYCDRHQLSMRERLELFQLVCHAVQHAHQKGVIHRDIKPSNVLVTIRDGKPVPKVIDFGIAKATNQRLTDKTVYTEMRQFVGTPAYMSPEQAEMTGLDIDTRSDIYSLGVLLYELLTGTTPFDSDTLKTASFADLQKMIREMDPPRPSTRLQSLGDTATLIAAQRRTDPAKLGRLIRGDLDWIVMKALEKDRTRRYDTANGLALDVGRYLHQEPVLAGPPSATYRLTKLIQRNRGVFVAVGAVAAALVIGLSLALYGFISATQERDAKETALVAEAHQRSLAETNRARAQSEFERAQREAANARQQAAKAEAVSRFLQDMLSSANAENRSREAASKGRDVTVVQLLAEAVKKLDDGALQPEPLVEAAVRETIGNTYKGLGDYPVADPHLMKALAMRRDSLGANHLDVAQSLTSLGVLRWRQGRLEEAEAFHREALGIRRTVLGEEDAEVAASLNELGAVLKAANRPAEAEALFRESLALRRKLFGEKHVSIAQSMHNLAWLLQGEGRLAEAEKLGREAVVMYRELVGDEHPSVASGLNNLALVLKQQGKLSDAEPIYREVVAMDRQLLGNDHPDLANSLMNTATLLRDAGKLEEAEPMYREALGIVRAGLPAGHANTATCLSGYGSLLLELNRADEAEPLLRESVAIRQASLSASDWRLAQVRSLLGSALAAQGKFGEAEPLLVEGYEVMKSSSGATPVRRRQALERVVKLYELWNATDPGQAASKLAEWRARLETEAKPQP